MMKKLVSFGLAVLCCTFTAYAGEAKTANILIESSTGQVLSGTNIHARLPIASVTKTMTLLLIAEELERGSLTFDTAVTTSAYASGVDGSVIWLEPGEVMVAGEMLKAIVISSANDATIALAEHVSGSEEEFVAAMNKKAAELGLRNTHFTGAVGYDDDGHYSSAYDVARITAELFKHNYYDEFYRTGLSSVRTGTERETQLVNTNKLATKYDGIVGGKTGTTDGAGFCLSVCAERDGMQLVAVSLGAKSDDKRVAECRSLLDHGFAEYELYTAMIESRDLPSVLVEKGVEKELALKLRSPVNCVIPKGRFTDIEYNVSIPEKVSAPIENGQAIGTIEAVIKDERIFTTDLIATGGTAELDFPTSLRILIKSFFSF